MDPSLRTWFSNGTQKTKQERGKQRSKHVENMLPFERSKCARLQSKAPKWIEWPACAC